MSFKVGKPGEPIPANMGAVADEYARTRQVRLAMEKIVEPVAERETELKEYMIANLEKSRGNGGDTGAAGKFYRVQIVEKTKAVVTDWPALHQWIAAMGRFDLLQKKLSDKPAMELIEALAAEKKTLPGVDTMDVPSVSVTKI